MDIKEIASQLALECLRRNKGDLKEIEVLEEYIRLQKFFEDELNARKPKLTTTFDIM
ncbi:hypothetical protein [Morganella sp. GD04133]|uniref:hypothetical protein n=1 Tax=Morganella sp. GD04133 TaxID=2975435 RepID=UPI00244D744D|nr:hypothetical protein [Morganella sp. GD04133]MDH0356517.1 hypothetical protein [Morganella sp. GD04133]